MGNELEIFNFEGSAVRTQVDVDGNPWWVAKDVCDTLGIANCRRAISSLLDSERGGTTVNTLGGKQELSTVSESGLYKLVFKSRKPSAQKFQTWITSEVLPEIRKTGSYSVKMSDNGRLKVIPAAEPVFRSLISVAQLFGLEENQVLLYANKATLRETGIDFQNILQIELKSTTQVRQFTPTELGERVGMSAIKFNRQLEALGFQEKRNDVWCSTEKRKPFSVLLDTGKKHSNGTPVQQLKWIESVLTEVA